VFDRQVLGLFSTFPFFTMCSNSQCYGVCRHGAGWSKGSSHWGSRYQLLLFRRHGASVSRRTLVEKLEDFASHIRTRFTLLHLLLVSTWRSALRRFTKHACLSRSDAPIIRANITISLYLSASRVRTGTVNVLLCGF
jgi:hypothetical protein